MILPSSGLSPAAGIVPPGALLLLVAASARPLAAAAVSAGYRALGVDWFADEDMAALCAASACCRGRFSRGFSARHLLAAVETVSAEGGAAAGLVPGSGFEDRPQLLARLGERLPIIGCSPDVVRRAKDPFALRDLTRELVVPFAEVAHAPSGSGWLRKRIGAAGGTHVRRARGRGEARSGWYVQRRVAGLAHGFSFLAGAHDVAFLGAFRQWSDPAPGMPHRFAGLVGPVALDGRAERIADRLKLLVRALGLRGLVSVDVMVDGEGWALTEVNPRPGFSLDLLRRAEPAILAHHCRAVTGGQNVVRQLAPLPVGGAMVVYARAAWLAPKAWHWPDFVTDRPAMGTMVPPGHPVATVHAEGEDEDRVTALLRGRARDLLAAGAA